MSEFLEQLVQPVPMAADVLPVMAPEALLVAPVAAAQVEAAKARLAIAYAFELLRPPAEPVPDEMPVRPSGRKHFNHAERLRTKVVAGALGLLVGMVGGLGVAVGRSQPLSSDPGLSATELYKGNPLPGLGLKEAIHPTTDALQEINLLLSQPDNPRLATRTREINEYLQEHPEPNPFKASDIAAAHVDYAIRKPVADELGLHVFDPTDTLTTLAQNMVGAEGVEGNRQPVMQIGEYIEVANKYLANFGLALEVPVPGSKFAYGLQPASRQDLDGYNIRDTIFGIVAGISRAPAEYVRLAGPTRIQLVSPPQGENSDILAYAGVWPDEDGDYNTIVVNARTVLDADGILHELYHFVNRNTAGGAWAMNNDRGYLKETGDASFSDADQLNGYMSLQQYQSMYQAYRDAVSRMRNYTFCEDLADRYNKRLAQIGPKVAFATGYGSSAMIEEEADLGKQLPDPTVWPALLDRNLPLMNEQLKYEEAMTYMYQPRIAMFFIMTADHQPKVEPDMAELCAPESGKFYPYQNF